MKENQLETKYWIFRKKLTYLMVRIMSRLSCRHRECAIVVGKGLGAKALRRAGWIFR